MSWSLHLCPDAWDIAQGYGANIETDEDGTHHVVHPKHARMWTYWDRIHINTPWVHIAFAINRRGRFSRLTRKNADGTWDESSEVTEWTMVTRSRRDRTQA